MQDTDGLIFVTKEGEPRLKLDDYLDNLTDELGGDSVALSPNEVEYWNKYWIINKIICIKCLLTL